MPSLVRIRIESARDLPVMDRSAQSDASTDAFVEVKLNNIAQKTFTYKKSLSPVWNTDFKFEVMDDSTLQDSPVEFSVMDQDLYSSELIGVVYVDLNPLIMRTAHVSSRDALVISGWFPIFDTVRLCSSICLRNIRLLVQCFTARRHARITEGDHKVTVYWKR
jgi:hypothetical protein